MDLIQKFADYQLGCMQDLILKFQNMLKINVEYLLSGVEVNV